MICECSAANVEWRFLNYEPGVIKFAKETRSLQEQDAGIEVTVPPFSSAAVPQVLHCLKLDCAPFFSFFWHFPTSMGFHFHLPFPLNASILE